MKFQRLTSLLILFTIITACAPPSAKQSAPIAEQLDQASETSLVWEQSAQVDEQGAVVVEVTPLNLNAQGNTLDFEVALNTHSVDLGIDLAQLAILTTDAGIILNATKWDAPRGGHHVSGKLIFPSTVDGNSVLDGANRIKLQIRDIDVGLREFEWNMH